MFRKTLTVLLIGTWINFSGPGLVEALDAPRPVSIHATGKELPPSVDFTDSPLESPFLSSCDSAIPCLQPVPSQIDGPTAELKAGKIYKVLRVFLI
jgi:hypothetical protein